MCLFYRKCFLFPLTPSILIQLESMLHRLRDQVQPIPLSGQCPWPTNKQVKPTPKPSRSTSQIPYYRSSQTRGQRFSAQTCGIPGQITLKILRIPSVQEAKGRSRLRVAQYSGGNERCHPLFVPQHKHTLYVPLQEPDRASHVRQCPLYQCLAWVLGGRLPRAGRCRCYA